MPPEWEEDWDSSSDGYEGDSNSGMESDPWDFWEVNLENDPGTVSDQEVNGEEINKEVPSFEDPKEEEEEEESSSRSLNKDNK